jgi:hypothetical protein
MRIETSSVAGAALAAPGNHDEKKGASFGLFADFLAKAGNTANSRDDGSDVATIKEKGFVGYFKELQARRLEELRTEILMSMGITEEDLANMPPEQRSDIEKMVSEEIKKRLAAESVMDNGNDENLNQGMGEQTMAGTALGIGFLSALEKPTKTDRLAARQEDDEPYQRHEKHPLD